RVGAGIDRWAARKQGHGLGRATVVAQRGQVQIADGDTDNVGAGGQPVRAAGADEVVGALGRAATDQIGGGRAGAAGQEVAGDEAVVDRQSIAGENPAGVVWGGNQHEVARDGSVGDRGRV